MLKSKYELRVVIYITDLEVNRDVERPFSSIMEFASGSFR